MNKANSKWSLITRDKAKRGDNGLLTKWKDMMDAQQQIIDTMALRSSLMTVRASKMPWWDAPN